LAAGGTALGVQAVKVVIDLESGSAVHLLGAGAWDLHYTFVREVIYGEPHLDRCDPEQSVLFRQGWGRFSQEQYQQTDTRRFLLGTLVRHAGTGIRTLEFVTGDRIRPDQMHHAFFATAAHVAEPESWALRPQSAGQEVKLRELEGTLPIVTRSAPLSDLRFQPLTPAVGFGLLQFISAQDLSQAALGPDVLVVTDDVPNDIPLVGGLITESPQTPLSHVNVLSRGRGTPNMALRDARNDPSVAPLLDKLVRLEVFEGHFELRSASTAEAEAFWETRRPTGPRTAPRLDLTLRGIQPLESHGLASIPAIGAKAAQLAELGRVSATRPECAGPILVPEGAFAIPVAHYQDHFDRSGARDLLDALIRDADFRADPLARAEGLASVRELMLTQPVDAGLLAAITEEVDSRFGNARVRFRSSSNVEDLPGFNGAGLYTSRSAELGDPDRLIEDALRTVWASLWNQRAYDERELAHIEQGQTAMGILVHQAFRSELANGVGVSRSIYDPTRGDMHYFNLQIGEASVANPAPGVSTEEVLYRFGRNPRLMHQARSSLTPFVVMSEEEMDHLACTLGAIHEGFRPLIDPANEDRWFAMDIEFKLVGESRDLVVKQARPYSFGDAEPPIDCREF